MKEKLETKLEEVRKQKEQTMANYNALCGAEQMLIVLLQESESDVNEQNTDN